MELTYILVDFENVQPQDLGLLDGQHYRVKVFHGSHQNKLDMAIVKALQPLGGHVEYVQSEAPGKNALDFHVAFCMGRLLQAHQSKGMPARFAVISRDGGFDPLLRHVRSLGYAAKQAGSIRELLDFSGDEGTRSPAPMESGSTLAVPWPLTDQPVIATTTSVLHESPSSTVVRIQAAGWAVPAQPAAQGKGTAKAIGVQPKTVSPTTKGAAEDIEKVIEHLHKHAKNRPTKRIALERHIPSLLGGKKRAPATVQSIVAELERRGIVEFSDKPIKYRIPAVKK